MYSTEEIKEKLTSIKMIGGECWVNIKEANRKSILASIEDAEEFTMSEILEKVSISEDDITRVEDIDLKLINNKIDEKAGIAEKAKIQKDIIEVYVKGKKGSDVFVMLKARDLFEKEII